LGLHEHPPCAYYHPERKTVIKRTLAILSVLIVFLATQSILAYAHDEKTTKTEIKCQMTEKCGEKMKCGEVCKQHQGALSGKADKITEKKAGCCSMQGNVSEKKEERKKD